MTKSSLLEPAKTFVKYFSTTLSITKGQSQWDIWLTSYTSPKRTPRTKNVINQNVFIANLSLVLLYNLRILDNWTEALTVDLTFIRSGGTRCSSSIYCFWFVHLTVVKEIVSLSKWIHKVTNQPQASLNLSHNVPESKKHNVSALITGKNYVINRNTDYLFMYFCPASQPHLSAIMEDKIETQMIFIRLANCQGFSS